MTPMNPNDKHTISIPAVEQQHDEFFKLITSLNKDDAVYRQDCKFCNHPLKEQAELKWESVNRSYTPVVRLFKEYHENNPESPKMLYANIRNHLLNHFDQAQRRVMMREYSENLLSVLNYKRSSDKRLEALKTGLEMRYFEIAADRSTDDIRSADMMLKLAKAVGDLEKTQAELRGEIKVVTVFMEKFRNAYVAKINAAPEADKPKLLEILEDIQGELEIN